MKISTERLKLGRKYSRVGVINLLRGVSSAPLRPADRLMSVLDLVESVNSNPIPSSQRLGGHLRRASIPFVRLLENPSLYRSYSPSGVAVKKTCPPLHL